LKDSRREADSSPSHRSFGDRLRNASTQNSGSKIILALDLPYRKDPSCLLRDSINLLEKVSNFICAVKCNFHLILPLSISEVGELNDRIHSNGLVSIADVKLNDIANTNEVAVNYLWDSGFDGVIANPFVGFKGGLDVVYQSANQLDKGVITLAYMSHPGADEGYGLETRQGSTLFELMLERANEWGSDGVIVGSTRSDRIAQARSILEGDISIISPGSGPQGGDASASLKAGSDYLIYGRSIVTSDDPAKEAKRIFQMV
jgi:orotidine-5'-phosphate decarboxylase